MNLNIPNHFLIDKHIEPDILFNSSGLDFKVCSCTRTRNFFYKVKDNELFIDYKAPFIDAKAYIKAYDNRFKIEFTPHLIKYSRVGLNIKNLIQLNLLKQNHCMIHAGCIESNGKASLIVSAKDMGKTSTVLSLLNSHNFMSDDLAIISNEGTVYSYPEPLQITPNTIHNYSQYKNKTKLYSNWLTSLSRNHTFNQTLGRLINLEHTVKYEVSKEKIVDKSKIENVFLLNTKSCVDDVKSISIDEAMHRIVSTTQDIVNPTKEPLLNFYSYVTGYPMNNNSHEIIYEAIKNTNCYEINADRVSEYTRLINKVI